MSGNKRSDATPGADSPARGHGDERAERESLEAPSRERRQRTCHRCAREDDGPHDAGTDPECCDVVPGVEDGEDARDTGDGHTKVIFRLAYESAGNLLGIIADRVAARQVGRNMSATLKNLKTMVEA